MIIATTLKEIGDTLQPLAQRKLKALSNVGIIDQRAFLAAWLQIEPTRRREITAALVSIAEDDIDFNFHTVLLVLLDDPDDEVRAVALGGLWELTSTALLRRLVSLLGADTSGAVREAAALGLGRFMYLAALDELPEEYGTAAFTTLLRAASDPAQAMDVRRRAVEGLGYQGSEPEVTKLIAWAYGAGEQLLRESALVAMGRSMDEQWLPAIDRELGSLSPALRYEAARAVGEMSDVATPLLSRLLPLVDDSDGEVSLAAIWSLGQVGGPHARRVLQRLARSSNETRKLAAQEALDELTLGDDKPQMM
jgi:HEAT repeat protein